MLMSIDTVDTVIQVFDAGLRNRGFIPSKDWIGAMCVVLETLSPATPKDKVKISPDPLTEMKELPYEFQLIHNGETLFTLREISIAENPGILADIESIIEGSGGLDVSIQAFIF